MTDADEGNVSPAAVGSSAPTTPAPQYDSALLDAAGALARDVPCRKCGYNLRGLRPDDRCPECAEPILTTVQGDLLRFADRPWLARVDNGVRWMLWAGAAVLALSTLYFVPVLIRTARIPMWLPMYLTPLMQLAGYYGVWLLTTREPDRFETGAPLRVCTRIAVVVWLALRATGLLFVANPWGAFVGNFFSACVGAIADIAALILLARLAARAHNPRLAQRIGIFTGIYAIGFTIALTAGLAGLASWLCSLLGARGPAAMTIMRVAGNVVVPPILILSAARLVVLFFVTKALAPLVEEPAQPE